MIDIIPAILENELDLIEEKVVHVAPFVLWVQIDFSDGTLLPSLSFLEIDKFKSLISKFPNLSFEAHLIVDDPVKYLRKLADVGFKRVIAHVEANDPRNFLDEAKFESIEIGLALDTPTDLEVIEPFAEEVDVVLLQMSEAGDKNQPIQTEQIEKIIALREHFPEISIEAEGGIDEKNIKVLVDAGATRLVSTGYIFKDNSVGLAIERLKKMA